MGIGEGAVPQRTGHRLAVLAEAMEADRRDDSSFPVLICENEPGILSEHQPGLGGGAYDNGSAYLRKGRYADFCV